MTLFTSLTLLPDWLEIAFCFSFFLLSVRIDWWISNEIYFLVLAGVGCLSLEVQFFIYGWVYLFKLWYLIHSWQPIYIFDFSWKYFENFLFKFVVQICICIWMILITVSGLSLKFYQDLSFMMMMVMMMMVVMMMVCEDVGCVSPSYNFMFRSFSTWSVRLF